jgi:lysophospholipase L1-like esterase
VSLGPVFTLLAAKPYPARLQELLAARYTAQTITVANAGKPGEWAADAVPRLQAALRSHSAEALLLMEGINDLNTLGERGIRATAQAVDALAREGRYVGARVYIATLPPVRPSGIFGEVAPLIPAYNAELRSVARGENATLVDVHAAFAGDLSLLGPDGLHPTEAGYERIAQTFFTALRTTLELPPATREGTSQP